MSICFYGLGSFFSVSLCAPRSRSGGKMNESRRDNDGFHVSWQQHGGSVCSGLQEMQRRSEFVDMTLAADGHLVRVHQLVVGLASPYLKQLIRSAPTPQPVIFLNNVSHKILCCILEYIYTGEVVVPAQELRNFLQVGKSLHVKGLEELVIPEEESASTIQNTIASANLQQGNIIIRYGDDNADTIKSGKRKSESETTEVIASPKKKYTALHNEVLHEEYDIDDADNPADNESEADTDGDPGQSATNTVEGLTPENLKPKLMFCRSQRGNLQVILNRFMYNFAHAYKDGRTRWECIDLGVKKCRAMITTEDGKLCNRLNAHNHPVHDEKIMKRAKKGDVYTTLDSAPEGLKNQEQCSKDSMPEV